MTRRARSRRRSKPGAASEDWTDLEQWFRAFGEACNVVIHGPSRGHHAVCRRLKSMESEGS